MTNGWSQERKALQADRIRTWRPWEQSTGPRTVEGKAIVARNAWRGGTRPALRALAETLRKLGRELADT